MKYSLLKQCSIVYKTMQQEIEYEATAYLDELKWIEWSFGLSVQTWDRIEKKVNDYRFLNQQEKICFYKSVKPQFIGMIDYFTLIYKSALFKPHDCMEIGNYWKSEQSIIKSSLLRLEIHLCFI